jgi:Tol biopolymer transport system component
MTLETSSHNRKTHKTHRNRRLITVLGASLALCCVVIGFWTAYDNLSFNPNGEIAYECFDEISRRINICSVMADASNQRMLTALSGESTSPTWSPSGERLAFINFQNQRFGVYVYNYSSQVVEAIWQADDDTPRDGLRHVVWSPIGNMLLLHGIIDDQNGLYNLDLDQEILEPTLTAETGLAYPHSPAYSTNGLQIYYMDSSAMYRVDATGSSREKLPEICQDMAISPIETTALCNGAPHRFYFMNLDNWTRNSHTNWSILLSGFRQSAWSPDGEHIVYVQTYWPRFLHPNGELWIMRADGSHPVKLTNGPNDRNPVWRPQP